jgi:hypothetical protein
LFRGGRYEQAVRNLAGRGRLTLTASQQQAEDAALRR